MGILGFLCLKQVQGFIPLKAPLYPNMDQVPPLGRGRRGKEKLLSILETASPHPSPSPAILWRTSSPGTSEIILVPKAFSCTESGPQSRPQSSNIINLYVNWQYYVETAVSKEFFVPSEDRLARFRCHPKLAATLFPAKVSSTPTLRSIFSGGKLLQTVANCSDLPVIGVQITLFQFVLTSKCPVISCSRQNSLGY